MIERIFIPVVLAIVLSYLYVDLHYWRHRQGYCWWKRVLWWAPAVESRGKVFKAKSYAFHL